MEVYQLSNILHDGIRRVDSALFDAYTRGNSIKKWVDIPKTASAGTAQDVAHFFQMVPDQRSTHSIVGQVSAIVQCMSESDGAGANCCLANNC